MKRLALAFALTTVAGMTLAPGALAGDDRRDHRARSGHLIDAGHDRGRTGYRHGHHGRFARGHRRHHGHHGYRYRGDRGHGRQRSHRYRRAGPPCRDGRHGGHRWHHGRAYGMSLTIDGVRFGVADFERR